MNIEFNGAFSGAEFALEDEKILLKRITFRNDAFVCCGEGLPNTFLFIFGEAYRGKQFNRYGKAGEILRFVGHRVEKNDSSQTLVIEEKNEKVFVKSFYRFYDASAVIEIWKEVTNISDCDFTLECICPLAVKGIMNYKEKPGGENALPYLWKPHNMWCTEANFEKTDLRTEGLRNLKNAVKNGKVSVCSNGTQTTNRYLPMGVLEKEGYGFLAFEIAPRGDWSYEFEMTGEENPELMLVVTGKSYGDNGWYKTIRPKEPYCSECVRLTGGKDLDDVVRDFTFFRRAIKVKHKIKPYESVIYNNFMHNTWDRPTEQSDEIHSKSAAECGADYYVIDAGWHDRSVNGISPTQAIGEWKENTESYPGGLNKTIEKIRGLGLKFGLWVELQSVGYYCNKPDLLDEDCFFRINGIKPVCNNRYQLNYANAKTRDYADRIMERIIGDYNPDYIKIDYNQTAFGNDCKSGSTGEGMAEHLAAYEKWFERLQEKYPDVIFETCSSGGMRNDPCNVRLSNVISVSDQSTYSVYPYIMANMPMCLLPEQSGVWNMPLRYWDEDTDAEQVVMNSVNSFYGVMHLAGRLNLVKEEYRELIREGAEYYKKLAGVKDSAIPVMPNGFTGYGEETVCLGFIAKGKLYLALYNLKNEKRTVTQDLSKYGVKSIELAYPRGAKNKFSLVQGSIVCEMEPNSARAFELVL